MGANAADLPFPDAAFDMVTCAEVIEHIPSPALERACREMARVARRYVLVGVPYRQDLRHGRTTCAACGKEARVPFKPREDRPVNCSECFAKMKEEGQA